MVGDVAAGGDDDGGQVKVYDLIPLIVCDGVQRDDLNDLRIADGDRLPAAERSAQPSGPRTLDRTVRRIVAETERKVRALLAVDAQVERRDLRSIHGLGQQILDAVAQHAVAGIVGLPQIVAGHLEHAAVCAVPQLALGQALLGNDLVISRDQPLADVVAGLLDVGKIALLVEVAQHALRQFLVREERHRVDRVDIDVGGAGVAEADLQLAEVHRVGMQRAGIDLQLVPDVLLQVGELYVGQILAQGAHGEDADVIVGIQADDQSGDAARVDGLSAQQADPGIGVVLGKAQLERAVGSLCAGEVLHDGVFGRLDPCNGRFGNQIQILLLVKVPKLVLTDLRIHEVLSDADGQLGNRLVAHGILDAVDDVIGLGADLCGERAVAQGYLLRMRGVGIDLQAFARIVHA